MKRVVALVLVMAMPDCVHGATTAPTCFDARSQPGPTPIALGQLRLLVTSSRTASLFHAVDQLAAWSPYCHRQYRTWSSAGTYDENGVPRDVALVRHAELRGRHGWGSALEVALEVDDNDVDHALSVAVTRGQISEADAAIERDVFRTWGPRLADSLRNNEHRVGELRDLLEEETPRFARLMTEWLQFAGVDAPRDPVRVFVVPSPGYGQGGGGANGDAIVLELPARGDVQEELTTLAHELVHVLLRPRAEDIERAARTCGGGLDAEILGEAIANATAPGGFAYGADRGDRLAVATRSAANPDSSAERYENFRRLAFAIRPPLWAGLRGGGGIRFDQLLGEACSAWRAMSSPPP